MKKMKKRKETVMYENMKYKYTLQLKHDFYSMVVLIQ